MQRSRLKRGSLSLSINAIVVVVLAFVMLGLGLTLTNIIFRGATDQVPAAISAIELGTQPTPSVPVTVPREVSIRRGSNTKVQVGFYNIMANTAQNAIPYITECISSDGEILNNIEKLPQVNAIANAVGPSEIGAFEVIISLAGRNNFGGGSEFICNLAIVDATLRHQSGLALQEDLSSGDMSPTIYAARQFTIRVTT